LVVKLVKSKIKQGEIKMKFINKVPNNKAESNIFSVGDVIRTNLGTYFIIVKTIHGYTYMGENCDCSDMVHYDTLEALSENGQVEEDVVVKAELIITE
jgi:hypothetical protein